MIHTITIIPMTLTMIKTTTIPTRILSLNAPSSSLSVHFLLVVSLCVHLVLDVSVS